MSLTATDFLPWLGDLLGVCRRHRATRHATACLISLLHTNAMRVAAALRERVLESNPGPESSRPRT